MRRRCYLLCEETECAHNHHLFVGSTTLNQLIYYIFIWTIALGKGVPSLQRELEVALRRAEEGQAEGRPSVMVPLNNVQFSRLLDFQQLLRLS